MAPAVLLCFPISSQPHFTSEHFVYVLRFIPLWPGRNQSDVDAIVRWLAVACGLRLSRSCLQPLSCGAWLVVRFAVTCCEAGLPCCGRRIRSMTFVSHRVVTSNQALHPHLASEVQPPVSTGPSNKTKTLQLVPNFA